MRGSVRGSADFLEMQSPAFILLESDGGSQGGGSGDEAGGGANGGGEDAARGSLEEGRSNSLHCHPETAAAASPSAVSHEQVMWALRQSIGSLGSGASVASSAGAAALAFRGAAPPHASAPAAASAAAAAAALSRFAPNASLPEELLLSACVGGGVRVEVVSELPPILTDADAAGHQGFADRAEAAAAAAAAAAAEAALAATAGAGLSTRGGDVRKRRAFSGHGGSSLQFGSSRRAGSTADSLRPAGRSNKVIDMLVDEVDGGSGGGSVVQDARAPGASHLSLDLARSGDAAGWAAAAAAETAPIQPPAAAAGGSSSSTLPASTDGGTTGTGDVASTDQLLGGSSRAGLVSPQPPAPSAPRFRGRRSRLAASSSLDSSVKFNRAGSAAEEARPPRSPESERRRLAQWRAWGPPPSAASSASASAHASAAPRTIPLRLTEADAALEAVMLSRVKAGYFEKDRSHTFNIHRDYFVETVICTVFFMWCAARAPRCHARHGSCGQRPARCSVSRALSHVVCCCCRCVAGRG